MKQKEIPSNSPGQHNLPANMSPKAALSTSPSPSPVEIFAGQLNENSKNISNSSDPGSFVPQQEKNFVKNVSDQQLTTVKLLPSIKNNSDFTYSGPQRQSDTYYDTIGIKFPPIDHPGNGDVSPFTGGIQTHTEKNSKVNDQQLGQLTNPDLTSYVNHTEGNNIQTIQNIGPSTTTNNSPSNHLPRIKTPEIMSKGYNGSKQNKDPRRKAQVSSSYRDQFEKQEVNSTITIVTPLYKGGAFNPNQMVGTNNQANGSHQNLPGSGNNNLSLQKPSMGNNAFEINSFNNMPQAMNFPVAVNNNNNNIKLCNEQHNKQLNEKDKAMQYSKNSETTSVSIPIAQSPKNFTSKISSNGATPAFMNVAGKKNFLNQAMAPNSLNNNINQIINQNLNRIANNPVNLNNEEKNRRETLGPDHSDLRPSSRPKYTQPNEDSLTINGGNSVMENAPIQYNMKDGARNRSLQRILYTGQNQQTVSVVNVNSNNINSSKERLAPHHQVTLPVGNTQKSKKEAMHGYSAHHNYSPVHLKENNHLTNNLINPVHNSVNPIQTSNNNNVNTSIFSLPLFDQIDSIYMKSVAYIHTNKENLEQDLIKLYNLDNLKTEQAKDILKSMNMINSSNQKNSHPNSKALSQQPKIYQNNNQSVLGNQQLQPQHQQQQQQRAGGASPTIFNYPKAKQLGEQSQRENNFMRNMPIASPDFLNNQNKKLGSFMQDRTGSEDKKQSPMVIKQNKSHLQLQIKPEVPGLLEKSISQIIDHLQVDKIPVTQRNHESDSKRGTDQWERLGITVQREIVNSQTTFAQELERINTLSSRNDQAILNYIKIRQNLLDIQTKDQLKQIVGYKNQFAKMKKNTKIYNRNGIDKQSYEQNYLSSI